MITLTTPALRRGAHVPPFHIARKSPRRSSVRSAAASAPGAIRFSPAPRFAVKYSDLDGIAAASPESVPVLDMLASHGDALVDRQMDRRSFPGFREKMSGLFGACTGHHRYGVAQGVLVTCAMLCILQAHGQPLLKTDPPAETIMDDATKDALMERALPLLDRLIQYSIELKRFAGAWGQPAHWKRMGYYAAYAERAVKSRPVKSASQGGKRDAATINGRQWALRMGLCLALLEAEQGADAAAAALGDIAAIARLRPRTDEGRRAVQISFELTTLALETRSHQAIYADDPRVNKIVDDTAVSIRVEERSAAQ